MSLGILLLMRRSFTWNNLFLGIADTHTPVKCRRVYIGMGSFRYIKIQLDNAYEAKRTQTKEIE